MIHSLKLLQEPDDTSLKYIKEETGELDITNYALLREKYNSELVNNVELAMTVYAASLYLLEDSFKYLAKKYNVELECVHEIAELAKDVVFQKSTVLCEKGGED